MRCWLLVFCSLLAAAAWADERVPICHGYGCLVQEQILYSDARLAEVGHLLNAAVNAAEERKSLAEVVGQLYAWGGEQSDIRNDRGGNYADAGIPGMMDCIDHSTSTTRLLAMLEGRGYLRWHRVLGPEPRYFAFVIANHYTAVIEEKTDGEAARFAVDSWFVDNGQPAVILPLAEWKKGAGPDV